MTKKKLLVVGGGAAGFFCAVNAARMNPQLEVILVEKTGKLLSKVKVSGGGRCNVTHACFDIATMSRRYPRGQHFVKKIFHQFFTTDTIQWFEERGVKLKAEEDGRMFPVSDSSQTIIDCLIKEVNKYKVEIRLNAEVKKIVTGDSGLFVLHFSDGKTLAADFICIAAGGYPKQVMYEWLKETGHSIEEPVPSLFTFNLPSHPITKLMGVSVENAKVKIQGTKLEQEGPLLITHWGMSGPVVLRLSAWGARQLATVNWQFKITVNWLPQFTEQTLSDNLQGIRYDRAAQKIAHKNPYGMPQRLWEFLLEQSGINKELRWADLPAKEQNKLTRNLCAHEFEVKGKTTFKEEFVTAGGMVLQEVDANTMMSKKQPGLFFAGEILDVDGITGGYNFQHAWTSGFVAAKAIAGQYYQGS
jgi:predicted Rossmann fold flavoprotein